MIGSAKIVNTSRILDGAFKILNKMKVLIMNVNRFHDKVQLDKNGEWREAQKIQQEPVIREIQPLMLFSSNKNKDGR